jgi:hypothetical protein
MRCRRPWLGPEVLARPTEPALQANLAAGMTAREVIVAYRQMYLYPLGYAAFVDHMDRSRPSAGPRQPWPLWTPPSSPRSPATWRPSCAP